MMQKILTFYKEVKQEALKITWPTKPEVITTTIMVFITLPVILNIQNIS